MSQFVRPFKEGQIKLRCIRLGKDYQIMISGGQEHIGALALAVCYDNNQSKVNVSQIAVYGHKEDELVCDVARRIGKELKCTVSVTAGIHFDDLSRPEIEQVLSIIDKLVAEFIMKLKKDY